MENLPEVESSPGFLQSKKTLLIVLAILFAGVGALAVRSTRPGISPKDGGEKGQTSAPVFPEAAKLVPSDSTATLVYGVWEEGKSVIKAINADSTNHVVIAKLPSNVKDVNVFSDHELLYLGETDEKDHAKKVNLYDLLTGQTKTLFEATSGFGIDDLVLSADRKWIATWEVKFASGSEILSSGESRVYTVNLANPESKILIVSEQNVGPTNFLRYPLFFDYKNRLYLDTFGPNGGGWNLGLWVANSDGTNLTQVSGMNDGMYGTRPIISADGKMIVFTGYDASAQFTNSSETAGISRAVILNPNLLQKMDLATFGKVTLLGSQDNEQYTEPLWSEDGQKIVFKKFKLTGQDELNFEGFFAYDLSTGKTAGIETPENGVISRLLSLKKDHLLIGETTANFGNLGNSYDFIFKSFSLADLSSPQNDNPVLSSIALQFVDFLDKKPGEILALNISTGNIVFFPQTIKLASFEMKPIAEKRVPQQNSPRTPRPTRDPNLPTEPPVPTPGGNQQLPLCHDVVGLVYEDVISGNLLIRRQLGQLVQCLDSPLYLYPLRPIPVSVKVGSPVEIFEDSPPYENGWQVIAYPEGKLIDQKTGREYDKISYAYTSRNVSQPKTGLVVTNTDLEETLRNYALKIGLVGREAEDFVLFWREKLPLAPYYFISHFSFKESRQILPLEINPKPDTLIQVVMYFKSLNQNKEVLSPVFEKVPERKGFTAVDWSGIIDR